MNYKIKLSFKSMKHPCLTLNTQENGSLALMSILRIMIIGRTQLIKCQLQTVDVPSGNKN